MWIGERRRRFEEDFSGDYVNGDISLHLSASDQDLYFFSNNRGIRYVGCERLEFEEMLRLRKREESRQRPRRYFRMDVFIRINMCLFMC